MSALTFKERYCQEWERKGNPRERIALEWLRLTFPFEVIPTGNGVMSPDWNGDVGSTPDFYVPSLKLWVEVTGSDCTRAQSMSRCIRHFRTAEPCLFVREGKVAEAKVNHIVSHLAFMSVNEMDGSVLFMPCSKVVNYPLVSGYEPGGERYYMIPWRDWMRPGDFAHLVWRADR